jgi:hypothetical protein
MISVFCGEEPHSRRYGRNATLRLLVQQHDELIIIIIVVFLVIEH